MSCLVYFSFLSFFVAFLMGGWATHGEHDAYAFKTRLSLCVTPIQMKIYNIIAHITFINTLVVRRMYKMYKIKEGATKMG